MDCSICLEEVAEKPLIAHPCRHEFCRTCILRWSSTNGNCPLCRQPINLFTDKKDGTEVPPPPPTEKNEIETLFEDSGVNLPWRMGFINDRCFIYTHDVEAPRPDYTTQIHPVILRLRLERKFGSERALMAEASRFLGAIRMFVPPMTFYDECTEEELEKDRQMEAEGYAPFSVYPVSMAEELRRQAKLSPIVPSSSSAAASSSPAASASRKEEN